MARDARRTCCALAMSFASFVACSLVRDADDLSRGGSAPDASAAQSDGSNTSRKLYRKTITIDHEAVEGSVEDFPLLVALPNATELLGKVDSEARNISFTTPEGSPLSHEVEAFDPTTGTLTAWVRVGALSRLADTSLVLLYGDVAPPVVNDPETVWSNGYSGVWHLGSAKDSTAHHNHGTKRDLGSAGKIAEGIFVDGEKGHVTVPNPPNGDLDFNQRDFTVSGWFFRRSPNVDHALVTKGPTSPCSPGTPAGYRVVLANGGNNLHVCLSDGTNVLGVASTTAWQVADSGWHQFVFVFASGKSAALYVDGVLETTQTTTFAPALVNPFAFAIGALTDSAIRHDGYIDEVRIASQARTREWVATEYRNQNAPSSFYRVGAEEVVDAPP